MLFFAILSVPLVSLLAQHSLAALTPMQIVTNIDLVATYSKDANTKISQLSTLTSPAEVVTIGQTLVTDFETIINSLLGDIAAMGATPALADNVTEPIVEALRDFVRIHQDLLSTVIGQHGIFAQFVVTGPILVVLRALEAQIDSFAFALIALIPSRSDSVQTGKKSLDMSVTTSINIYTQLCIPSLLYPIVMPICVNL